MHGSSTLGSSHATTRSTHPRTRALKAQVLAAVVCSLGLLSAGCGSKYPKCDDDDDCKQGEEKNGVKEYCVNGQCQQCRDSGDCQTGQTCQAGRCESTPGYCQSAGDCPSGQECRGNRCVSSGTGDGNSSANAQGDGSCTLIPVYFEFDSEVLSTSARDKLQDTAKCISQRNLKQVRVIGHTDPRGTEEYNLALGERRARAASQFLGTLGLQDAALSTSSMGEEMAGGEDESGWSSDRKVEFDPQ